MHLEDLCIWGSWGMVFKAGRVATRFEVVLEVVVGSINIRSIE